MYTKLDKIEVRKIWFISIVIAIITIIMTIFVGILSVVLADKTQIFDIELGLPLGWFRFYTLSGTSFVNIEISNWLNLIVDLIFYLLLCFGLSSLGEILLKNIKIKPSGT